jgi:4-amino-4-deoxy-L-arabinose transferase-like glycosyltransferase
MNSPMTSGVRLFLLFAALSFLTRALALGIEIVDVDEASYAVAGAELLRGKLLYRDVADHHPPLAYAYFALARRLFGPGLLPVRLITHLLTIPLTAFGLAAFFRYDRRGVAAGLAYLLFGAAFIGHDMLAVNCELLMLLPAAWALVLLRDEDDARAPGRAAAAGALLGLAVLAKYQAALWLPALALALLRAGGRRDRVRSSLPATLALCFGFLLPLVLAWAVFAALGAGPDFLYWNLTRNFGYTANPIPAAEAAEKAAVYLLPFLVVTVPLWAGWALARPIDVAVHPRCVTTLVLLSSLAAAALGLRFYPHYFIQLLPPLALGAAPWLAGLEWAPLRGAARGVAGWIAVALAGFALSTAWLYYGHADVYNEARPVHHDVAERLRSDPCYAGASLFVWGWGPLANHFADLPLGTRFLFVESTLVGYVSGNRASVDDRVAARRRIDPRHWDWLMSDLERSRATYILDTAPAGLHRWQNYPLRDFPRLNEYVRANYDVAYQVDGVVIYRRRGCASP